MEITDYIKEFNEEFMHKMNEYSFAKDSSNFKVLKKKIKLNLLKKLFFENKRRKLITWRLGGILNNRD